MKLVVGLGNPGRKYQGTRHNIGFEVTEELARRFGGDFRSKFKGLVCDIRVSETPTLLLMPTTYMNLSGAAVVLAKDFYKIGPENLLVVCDDFNLPLANLRFRARGSAGGQNGLADILRRLGGTEIARLRFGIGHPPPRWDPADFVLGKFGKQEREQIDHAIIRAADGVADWVARGIDYCMNQYNAN